VVRYRCGSEYRGEASESIDTALSATTESRGSELSTEFELTGFG